MTIQISRSSRTKIFRSAIVAATLLVCISLSYVVFQSTSRAADIRSFDPGNIMSDAVMSNKSSMSVQQIQTFLDSKNACNNTNTHMASWYPHLQYSIRDGKFVCMAKESFGGKSAAQIIWQVAQDYSINPQALIVLLEKEQGLVTDTWPNSVQYRTATGYGCPDTAPCDAQYFGLENQLKQSANLFRVVLNGGWSNYPVGYTFVQYNPNAACGGSLVHIQNRTTSALYRYTPYQPNQSALNAGYGSGDSCGAYGNRNFWLLFTDWFGSTHASGFASLDDPRWMKVTSQTQKIRAYTGQRFGPVISAGTQAKFVDKVLISNRWIARTEWDRNNGNLDGFPANELSEIDFEKIPTTYMVLNKDSQKRDTIRDKKLEYSPSASLFRAADKVTVNNTTYYRTEWEKANNRTGGFVAADVENFRMFDFATPRNMITKKTLQKIDVLTGAIVGSLSEKNIYYFNKFVRVSGVTYAQLAADNNTNYAVPFDSLGEIVASNPFYDFTEPRIMTTTAATSKYQVLTGAVVETPIPSGTTYYFVDQIKISDTWYARTESDRKSNKLIGVPVNKLGEVSPVSIQAKWMTVKNTTKKVDPVRKKEFESIQKDSRALFTDKITVLGKDYYRTDWEASQNRFRYISAEDLAE
ncbi:hypothetical protein I8H83_03500 [Candidatus Saccharibacteria bacterium]|nr:hypothetical protein [Candidatus Saccharibacteria bacterium]